MHGKAVFKDEPTHLIHLISELLKPGLTRLDERKHMCELLSDNGLLDEWFTKDLSLMSPFL
jgi:hypothetical protein